MFLNESEKQRISAAIRKVESRTSGELVTVIVHASDAYRYIPLLWASLIALSFPALAYLLWFWMGWLGEHANWGHEHPYNMAYLYIIQIAIFVLLVPLFLWQPLKMRLIPRSVKHLRASRFAYEQFFAQGLHLTRQRNGILIYVSVAERFVEILADKGINDRVEKGYWDEIVNRFILEVREERIADGFISAIESCGEVLAQHFPHTADDIDELPNHLVEIR